jgi:hypothetical protein
VAPVRAGQAPVQQGLELLGGTDASIDVPLGRVLGEPLNQVGAQGLGKVLIGAVLEALAAAVQLGLGGGGSPAYSAFSGVSTETMRTGWSMTGVSPSEIRDRVWGRASRSVRGSRTPPSGLLRQKGQASLIVRRVGRGG